FAKYLVDHALVPADQDLVRIETVLGVQEVTATRDYEGRLYLATVNMGAPVLESSAIPTTFTGDPVLSQPLQTALGVAEVTCVSMGNPHAVLVVDDAEEAPVWELGALIELDEHFPRRTNVEFAQVIDRESIRLRVWERGVGETLACGTGACATVVALSLLGLTERQATVELPGGELAIHWTDEGPVMMTGPATEVFTGTVHIDEDDDVE
ncbi:MAG: diaminopimelate epimerase, partial [Actinobacteria bacterium]